MPFSHEHCSDIVTVISAMNHNNQQSRCLNRLSHAMPTFQRIREGVRHSAPLPTSERLGGSSVAYMLHLNYISSSGAREKLMCLSVTADTFLLR
jgi:hypothetical protein